MRYQFSGKNEVALGTVLSVTGWAGLGADASALCIGTYLIGRANTTGRTAFLRWMTVYDPSAAVAVALHDGTDLSVATSSTRRSVPIRCASGQTTMVEWPAPGLKFTTGIVITKVVTDASGSVVDIGCVGGGGYEE